MEIWHAILLGIIEGITEFLPISSTGHLTIAEKLLGYQLSEPGIVAFTAIVQLGAIAAAIWYFRQDIVRIAVAWVQGLFSSDKRNLDYKMGWAVIIGSIPIAVIGLVFKDEIETVLRSLWFVVAGLILWSVVMWLADRYGKQTRKEKDVTWKDTLIIGLMQSFSLIPGVSRSGATISAGLLRQIDRITATRLSFFLGIPALVAAGILQAATQTKYVGSEIGWVSMIAGIAASFVVGYLSIAWLLRYLSKHNFTGFIVYRLALAVIIAILLLTNTIGAV